MDVAVALLALLFVLFVVAGAVAAVKTVRAVKRGVARTVTDTRRTVEETSLKARRAVQPGPVGDIAGVRLSLRTSIDSTRREIEGAVGADPGLRESLDLLDRLHEYARLLDGELRHLEREPDKARIAEQLPEARARADRIRHSADSLRWAAQDRARHAAGDGGLESLSAQIDVEAGALRHWTPTSASESASATEPDPKSKSASAEGTGPKPEIASASSSSAASPSQDAFQTLLAKIEKLRRPESA